MMINQSRFNVFGIQFTVTNLHESIRYIEAGKLPVKGYISFPSTDVVSKATKDSYLRSILNNSIITFTDGKFTEFYARLKGMNKIQSVSGYDLLDYLLNTKATHYFYGLNPNELKLLEERINVENPNSIILGYKSPPFLEINEINDNKEIQSDIKEINSLRPDFIWIGISSPKQDYLMSYYQKDLDKGIMVGVGAVLLYKAGLVNKGPQWIKDIGMRWLVRFVQEPVRVWKKRSLQNIIFFVYLIIKHDIFKVKYPNN